MKNILIDYIAKQVTDDLDTHELDIHDDLLGSGILDSLGMVRLIQFIETEFDLTVPPEDMIIDHFMTIEHICNYIESKSNFSR